MNVAYLTFSSFGSCVLEKSEGERKLNRFHFSKGKHFDQPESQLVRNFVGPLLYEPLSNISAHGSLEAMSELLSGTD